MNYMIVTGYRSSHSDSSKNEEIIIIFGLDRQKVWTLNLNNENSYTLKDMILSLNIKYSDCIYLYNASDNVKNELKQLHYDYRVINELGAS